MPCTGQAALSAHRLRSSIWGLLLVLSVSHTLTHDVQGTCLTVSMTRAINHSNHCLLACSLPTLFLSECCLIYMEPPDAAALLAWAASHCARGVVAIYEQTRPDDAFGVTMLNNLEVR